MALSEIQLTEALSALNGWTLRHNELVLEHEIEDFSAAIRLVNSVAVLAEEAEHHPDIDIRWRMVTFALCTHSAGLRITELDISMAAKINSVISSGGGIDVTTSEKRMDNFDWYRRGVGVRDGLRR
ncbi:4a-hydroxytetrahydrobiopterin dehydratase [Streptomyces violaceoruber]|uniref:4a-hydroxytetrahydrobiopterin dehydratase n=1 Tax=Streptomyces violaceoruber TaxID=1935 RepID=UPI00403CC0A0